jgi:hypothetical protein
MGRLHARAEDFSLSDLVVRSFKSARIVLPLLLLAAFWWARPEEFAPLLRTGFVINVGSSGQPHELFVPALAIVLVPLALRFGLPLILKAAALLPFAATALTHQVGREAMFDAAHDLPNDGLAPGSAEEAAIDKAIAAALAARNAAASERPAFAKADRAAVAVTSAAASPRGRQDAAA